MTRKKARECFMQLLYQMDVQQDFSQSIKERFYKEYIKDEASREYLDQMYKAIQEHLPEIDSLISAFSERWKIDRIAKVDLAVLRLSTAEILYLPDIPVSASINEAVLLGKKFGGEDSSKFINGILGKIARDGNDQKR